MLDVKSPCSANPDRHVTVAAHARRDRRWWLIALVSALVSAGGGCSGATPYDCGGQSALCRRGAFAGMCLPSVTGATYCAYGDATCPVPGLRWDDSASSDVAGTCVAASSVGDLSGTVDASSGGRDDGAVGDQAGTPHDGSVARDAADGMGPVDALPVDAPPVDAPPIDALPVDAPPVDAPPVDASALDATRDGPVAVGWTQIATPGGTSTLASVWAASASDVWAAGFNYDILHSTGGAFSKLPFPTVAKPKNPSPHHVSGGAGHVYVVTGGDATDGSAVLHTFDGGGSWMVSSLVSQDLSSVWRAPGGDVWAIGTGIIAHAPSGGWSTTWAQSNLGLRDIWGASTELWAVGGPNVLHTANTGVDWDSQPIPTDNTRWPVAIAGASATDLYMVGERGYIWHGDGKTWTSPQAPVPLPSNGGVTQFLRGIWISPSHEIYVVGDQGTILRSTDGMSWKQETAGVVTGVGGPSLYGVYGVGNQVFVVGESGLVLRKN